MRIKSVFHRAKGQRKTIFPFVLSVNGGRKGGANEGQLKWLLATLKER